MLAIRPGRTVERIFLKKVRDLVAGTRNAPILVVRSHAARQWRVFFSGPSRPIGVSHDKGRALLCTGDRTVDL